MPCAPLQVLSAPPVPAAATRLARSLNTFSTCRRLAARPFCLARRGLLLRPGVASLLAPPFLLRASFSDATPCCVIDSVVVLVALLVPRCPPGAPVPFVLLPGGFLGTGKRQCVQLLLQASEVYRASCSNAPLVWRRRNEAAPAECECGPAILGHTIEIDQPCQAQHLNGMLEQLFEKIYVVNAEISERMIVDDQATSQPAESIMATAQPGEECIVADAQVSIQPQGCRERRSRWRRPEDPSREPKVVIQGAKDQDPRHNATPSVRDGRVRGVGQWPSVRAVVDGWRCASEACWSGAARPCEACLSRKPPFGQPDVVRLGRPLAVSDSCAFLVMASSLPLSSYIIRTGFFHCL